MKSNLLKISSYIGIFLIFSGSSYYLFGQLLPVSSAKSLENNNEIVSPSTEQKKTGVIPFSGPKTEVCPLNGALYTKEEKAVWSQRRPLMVMIENHADSRPQSGLQNADIVYEAVAEGGITRFMGVFYCGAVKGATQKYDIGPVRSARTYFLDLASEYSDAPLYVHVGGANCSAATNGGPCTTNKKAQALEQIDSYGWMKKGTWSDLSEFSLSYKACRREPDRIGDGVVRATEHTMYCNSTELWNVASDRGLTNLTKINGNSWDKNYKSWNFNQKDIASNSPVAGVSFDFWSGYKDYSVNWKYDATNNVYSRLNGGQSHIDFNTQQTITTKNIVIQYVKETRAVDEHLHNLYDVIGSGKGVLLQNGTKQDITWAKSNRTSRTIYRDNSGKEVNFVPGQIWIEILPINNVINYEG